MSAALDSRDRRAAEHLLSDCATLEDRPRRPVLDRLSELIGVDLTRLLLVGLTRFQRARSAPRRALGRGSSAP